MSGSQTQCTPPGLDAVEIGGGRKHGKNHVLLRHREIVHQRNVRNLKPFFFYQLAFLVRHAIGDVACGEPVRLIAKEVQILRILVEARVRGHCLAPELAPIVEYADCFEGFGMKFHCQAVFFQGQ